MIYKLIIKVYIDDLNKEVNKHIEEGWRLHEAPIVGGTSTDGLRYGQAMILPGELEDSQVGE